MNMVQTKIHSSESTNRRRANKEAFFALARARYGNRFDYSGSEYKGSQIPIKILCPAHGVFKQTPEEHLHNKCGCVKCAGGGKPYLYVIGTKVCSLLITLLMVFSNTTHVSD